MNEQKSRAASLGGLTAAANMTPEERSTRARTAVQARWMRQLPAKLDRKAARRAERFAAWEAAWEMLHKGITGARE